MLTIDRGTHNRGVFGSTLAKHGVFVRPVGLESPEQLGRGERHGGIFKQNVKKVVRHHYLAGKEDIKIAAAESIAEKNEVIRRGGFSPSQWVLGRAPRSVGRLLDEEEMGQLGTLDAIAEGGTEFARKAQIRLTARKEYVRQDCSAKAHKSMLRRSAPMLGDYRAGDLVCFRR